MEFQQEAEESATRWLGVKIQELAEQASMVKGKGKKGCWWLKTFFKAEM